MKRPSKEIPIDDSPFYRSLRKRINKLYFTKARNIRTCFSERDLYQKEILEICLRISGLLETLRLCRFFIGERKNVPADNNLKIKNAEFLRYHLECYFIRATTFKDLMLKLYNRVYQFGFTEKNGLESKIKKRAEDDNNIELLNLLKGLSILMTHINPIRNKIAHGGYHDDIELITIEGEEGIRKGNKSTSLTNIEYKAILHRLLINNVMDMHMNEIMMASQILLSYKKLYKIRKAAEKKLLQKT